VPLPTVLVSCGLVVLAPIRAAASRSPSSTAVFWRCCARIASCARISSSACFPRSPSARSGSTSLRGRRFWNARKGGVWSTSARRPLRRRSCWPTQPDHARCV